MSLIIVIVVANHKHLIKKYVQPMLVEYNADIHGKFAVCKLTQTFNIATNGCVVSEGIYQFPVDFNSAFCDLTVKTPRELLHGVVKERSDAKKIYDNAK